MPIPAAAPAPTLTGKLLSIGGHTDVEGVTVWFAYRSLNGDATTVEHLSDSVGSFEFDLPPEALSVAHVGAALEGVEPVDLEPDGKPLAPGSVILIVDDIVPSHLRYGGLA